MWMLSRPLEIQNSVDQVLERFWSGNGAILRDVADQKDRNMLLLCPKQQLRRNLSDLTDAAWSHFKFFAKSCLYGINDHHLGSKLFSSRENFLDRHFGINMQIRGSTIQTLSPHLDLLSGFFAGRIKDDGFAREARRHIQHERRLSDARIPAQEYQRTGHNTSSENAIEFSNSSGRARSFDAG